MLRRWRGGGASDRELDAELESFLQHDIDDRIASGMTGTRHTLRRSVAINAVRAAMTGWIAFAANDVDDAPVNALHIQKGLAQLGPSRNHCE